MRGGHNFKPWLDSSNKFYRVWSYVIGSKFASTVPFYNFLAAIFWLALIRLPRNTILLYNQEIFRPFLAMLEFFKIMLVIQINLSKKDIFNVNAKREFLLCFAASFQLLFQRIYLLFFHNCIQNVNFLF